MERAEIVRWLKEDDPEKLQELYSMACSVKRRVLKNTVCVHGIIEFSNYCFGGGARGMLFRFETSDTFLYAALHPGGKLENRLKHLRLMKEIGFILASGPMLGIPSPWPEKIPDQTLESIADDILLMKDLGVKMATFGPYIKATDAVLARLRPEVKHGEAELVLKVIALTRLTMPGVRIPCTTALEAVGRETVGIENIRRQAIKAGATPFMPSLTPPEFFQPYRLYKEKNEGCFMSRKTMNE